MMTSRLLQVLRFLGALGAWCCANATAAQTSGSHNPFHRFTGEWTLKHDRWSHNWGQGEEVISIPGHHTLSKPLNTENSMLSVVDRTEPRGHILWSYNPATKEVHHLSSFGTSRNGVGKGTLSPSGDLILRINFSDEAPGTYRIYTYRWVSDDEYEMLSTQYDAADKPTGIFYGGTFVRIDEGDRREKDLTAMKAVLRVIDDNNADLATKLSVYVEDVVHMAPNNRALTSRSDLGHHLEDTKKHGYADMTHEIVDFTSYEKIVVMRGRVTGTYHPTDGSPAFAFKTKNLFVFRRQDDGSLKVWQVIFNPSPE